VIDMEDKEILVEVEPRGKKLRLQVFEDTKVEDVINTCINKCEEEGINVSEWGRQRVGFSNVNFTIMRKSTGNTALAPTVTFGEVFPELNDRESFKLDARAKVGR
jgi:hypothetical protein